jgi:glycosyltransferase involved in cell wall biosynthesis
VKLIILGAQLEAADFWRGFEIEKGTSANLETADLVVLPAFVEHKPRRLLQAVANRIPIIASKACGVETIEGVINIEAGDADSLRREIEKVIFAEASPALKEFFDKREIAF